MPLNPLTQSAAPNELPRRGSKEYDPKLVLAYIDSRIPYQSPLRRYDVLNWRRAELYEQSTHAIKLAYTALDSQYATAWARDAYDPNDPMSLPKPVLNIGLDPRLNESARLAKPEYKPKVRPKGQNPDIKAKQGAKKGERYLKSELKRLQWDLEIDKQTYHMPLYGGAWAKSWWEQVWTETTTWPVLTAMACPRHKGVSKDLKPPMGGDGPAEEACEFILAEDMMPAKDARGFGLDLPEEAVEAKIEHCLTCPDKPGLVKFQPSLEEAREAKDSIGRPMGKELPTGRWAAKTCSPYDVFEMDYGVDTHSVMQELIEVHAE
ncbi:MAG: hypothetical protein ACRDHG_06040, partial [Anaerolineales bacterium]